MKLEAVTGIATGLGEPHLIKQENQKSLRGAESKQLRAGAQLGGGPTPVGAVSAQA